MTLAQLADHKAISENGLCGVGETTYYQTSRSFRWSCGLSVSSDQRGLAVIRNVMSVLFNHARRYVFPSWIFLAGRSSASS